MIIHRCQQRSSEWFALRIGRVTGTRFAKMAGGTPSTFETLCKVIAAEKITGKPAEKEIFITHAMQHGIDTEDDARYVYEMETMNTVEQVGFIERDDMYGISPDGIMDNCGLEIKCPLPHTHLSYLLSNAWKAYKWQVQGSLWVTGFDCWDFVSYCPSYGDGNRIKIESVEPDAKYQEIITEKSELLTNRVKQLQDKYNEIY